MSLRCVAADSIYANNANRKFSMQHRSMFNYQRFSILIGIFDKEFIFYVQVQTFVFQPFIDFICTAFLHSNFVYQKSSIKL